MRKLFIIGMGRGENLFSLLKESGISLSCAVAVRSLPERIKRNLETSGIKIRPLEEVEKNYAGLSLGDLRKKIAGTVLGSAEEEGEAACLLPGRPWPGDGLYQELLKQAEKSCCPVEVFPGEDLCSPVLELLQKEDTAANFSRGVTWIDALCLDELREPPRGELLVANAAGGYVLQKAKEVFKMHYPPHHPIDIFKFNGAGEPFRAGSVRLDDLDEVDNLHCWTFLRIPPRPYYYLGDMVHLMGKLRSPEGCPWDREQDHQSLQPFLLEEAYEVLEAIDRGEPAELCEELGDLLLQIVFHSQLAAEKDEFYLWQVIDGISRKIYRRHPHVFQNEKVRDAGEVSLLWQQIKDKEKGGRPRDRFALPSGFPALLRAQKIQKKASQVGFDWPDKNGALLKVFEELEELRAVLEDGRKEMIAEEMGDLFFSLVNVARFVGVDAEIVLNRTVDKFIRRFRYIEDQVQKRGGDFKSFTLQELDAWWEEAKKTGI